MTTESTHQPKGSPSFTLIEALGSLAIITLLSMAVTVSVFETVERSIRIAERDSLETLASGFREYIKRFHIIPGTNDWASALTDTVAAPALQIMVNDRGNTRRLLVDPNFWGAGNDSLPYQQSPTGSVAPSNPRLIILSSVGDPLPQGSIPFQPVWDWAEDGATPTGQPWDSWSESGTQLMCKRFYVGDLFHQITLQDVDGSGGGAYRVNDQGSGVNNAPVSLPGGLVDTHFLSGTVVTLTVDSQIFASHVIQESQSFFFDRGAWRSIAIDRQADVDPWLEATLLEFSDWTTLYNYEFRHLIMNVKEDSFMVQLP